MSATIPAVSAGWKYEFRPHTKQKAALKSTAREILYGGSVYSGKSEVLLAACIDLCTLVPGSMALLIRRTTDELRELKRRIVARVPSYIATLNKSDNTFYFYNGAQLVMRFLDSEEDATKVQGFEAQLACFDELTHYERDWYAEVVSRLRATGEVKRVMDWLGLVPRALSASNPGGRGHGWVKSRFIDPAPPNTAFTGDDGTRRLFLQATIWDNPYADVEDYITNSLGPLSPERKRALLYGDWNLIAGVRFSQWSRDHHVIEPSDLPLPLLSGPRVIAVDYGFSDPFAVLWGVKLADGLVCVYRELYATELTPTQQAELILANTPEEEWRARPTLVMDPATWGRTSAAGTKTGTDAPPVSSVAHDYQRVLGITPLKANNDRKTGWSRVDDKLLVRPDGWPRLVVYNTCVDLIRTLPALQRSKRDPDDVGTSPKQEDHLGDTLRYLLMNIDPKGVEPRPGQGDPRPKGHRPVTQGLMDRKF